MKKPPLHSELAEHIIPFPWKGNGAPDHFCLRKHTDEFNNLSSAYAEIPDLERDRLTFIIDDIEHFHVDSAPG